MQSPNDTQYKTWCRLTVISKPSLFSGLFANQHLPIPGCFPADIMHFISRNLTDLLINLWHGTINCDPHDNHDTWDWAVLIDKTWKVHGRWVADTKLYLPGSFDCLQKKILVDIKHGNFSSMYLLLSQVCFWMSSLTFIGHIFVSLWLGFTLTTNESSDQHSFLMLISFSLYLLRSLRSYTISGKSDDFIFVAKVCMHCFIWHWRSFELGLVCITQSGRWSALLESWVKRSNNPLIPLQTYHRAAVAVLRSMPWKPWFWILNPTWTAFLRTQMI